MGSKGTQPHTKSEKREVPTASNCDDKRKCVRGTLTSLPVGIGGVADDGALAKHVGVPTASDCNTTENDVQ